MNLQPRPPLHRATYVGLMFLVVANIARVALERHTAMPDGPRDGVVGLLFGIAIGSMLLGIWRTNRSSGASDKRRCG